MAALVGTLLVPEHARAIACLLEVSELRRLSLLSRGTAAAPIRTLFEARAAEVCLYVCGSQIAGDDGEVSELAAPHRFGPFAGIWESLPAMPVQRQSVILAELDGILYAGSAFGDDEDGTLLKFDPLLSRWEAMPGFLIPRVGYSLTAAAGHLFVFGGCHDGFEQGLEPPPATGERFDVGEQLWCFISACDVQRRNPLVVQDADMLYLCATIFGNVDDDDDDDVSDGDRASTRPPEGVVHALHATTLEWERLPQPACWRPHSSPHMAMMRSSCGSVYVGSDQSIDRFDVAARRWHVLPNMPEELSHIDSSEVAYRGRLFICGGSMYPNGLANSFGCFDPRLGCWQVLPTLPSPGANPAMVGLGGQIYVCGGSGKASMRFCLVRGSWESLPDLPEPVATPEGVVSLGGWNCCEVLSF